MTLEREYDHHTKVRHAAAKGGTQEPRKSHGSIPADSIVTQKKLLKKPRQSEGNMGNAGRRSQKGKQGVYRIEAACNKKKSRSAMHEKGTARSTEKVHYARRAHRTQALEGLSELGRNSQAKGTQPDRTWTTVKGSNKSGGDAENI